MVLPDGRQVSMHYQLHKRRYLSVFGEFVLRRAVYGTREGQKIEYVPLDERLQLPESKFSCLFRLAGLAMEYLLQPLLRPGQSILSPDVHGLSSVAGDTTNRPSQAWHWHLWQGDLGARTAKSRWPRAFVTMSTFYGNG